MPAKYFTILTNIGSALHANAQIQQTKVPWTHMALGDGSGVEVQPEQKQTGLVREVHRLPITAIDPHPTNPNWIVVEAVVPNNVGGWTVRETAIFGGADNAQCIAVGNYPASYKPVLADGAVREMVMRMIVEISSTATVNLVIDPAVAIASRGWVESLTANTERRGIVEMATTEEAIQGDDKERAITPFTLRKIVPRAAFIIVEGDANSILGTGLYYMSKGLNCPIEGFYGWVRHSEINHGRDAYQEAFTFSNEGFWRRYLSEGVWREWKAVPNQDAITALAEAVGQKEPAIQAGSANTYFAGDKTWRPAADMPIRPAKTTESGVVKLATNAQLAAGTDSEAAVTPAQLKPYLDAIAADGNRWVYRVGVNTWQVPEEVKSGKKKVRVRGVGGGGSGAWVVGTNLGGNSAGGSGAGGFEIVTLLVGIESVPISVGAGGVGVGGAGNEMPGNNGGATSFGVYASASGGYGGNIDANLGSGGSAASSVNNALLIRGGSCGASFVSSLGNGIYGGRGGGSMLGQGGEGSVSGISGTGFGTGSGGACGAGTGSSNGMDGILIIEVV